MDQDASNIDRDENGDPRRAEFRQRIETAKELLPLEEMIQQLGDWEGQVEKNLCPFHPDRTPSFSIFASHSGDLWKCHTGCGTGDQINYLQVKFQISRGEAIRTFLEMAGLANQGGGRFWR
jgi:DNA primase